MEVYDWRELATTFFDYSPPLQWSAYNYVWQLEDNVLSWGPSEKTWSAKIRKKEK